MKKKYLAMIFAAALTVSACAAFSGCSSDQTGDNTDQTEVIEVVDANEANKVLQLSFEGSADDSSAAGNNGTINKEGRYVDGVNGQALYFDGSTYIDLGTSGQLQPSTLTFAAWIKSDGGLTGEHMITWFKPNGNYQGEGWYLSCLDNNTPLKLSVGKSAGQPMEIFVSGSREVFFPAGEWVHVAVTYDSASHTAAIYRNGIAQDVQYINNISEINADEASSKYIGFNSPRYNGGFARLAMDELAIYNKVLTAGEVVELYTCYGAEFDSSKVVENDWESLSIPVSSVKSDITLPTVGASGSAIAWSSSDPSALTAEGKVTRPAAGQNDAQVTLTAEISYAGHTKAKDFTVCVEAMPAFEDLSDFDMGAVEIMDAYELNAFSLETEYLLSLDADRLLKGFCDIGGVQSAATLYGGWENSAIKGHTLGHYLTAVSQAYAMSGDPQLRSIAGHVVDVLAQCQNPESGYLAAIPESHYIQIEKGNTAGTWVPWYTMHKVLSGLIDAYELTGDQQALEVASKLGDWVYSRTSAWTPAIQATVLNVEYGGMNDCLYQLYMHTQSEKHLSAAHSFDELTLFEALYNGQDVLNGKHANTTIPKIIGALSRYIALGEGEEYYLQVAENFWEIVVSNHTYITGGNSEWEHFGEANVLDAERTNCNCETCNTYNMLKLSRELFKITGNRKYADYYENTFINAILSSQNPETGMTTYFQPMATGFFKVYSSQTGHFWCCTGSGMENFSKLSDSIYYKDENSLYVIRYTDSRVNWDEKQLTITQETDIPLTDTALFTVSTVMPGVQADIVLRVPDWCTADPTVYVNGFATGAKPTNGFIRLSGMWKNNDTIEIHLPMTVEAYDLPDNANVVGFKYGPVVLSANLGTNNMATGTTGVDVTIPTLDSSVNDCIRINDGTTIDQWLANIADNLVRNEDAPEGTLEFTLKNTDRGELVFSPHYLQYQNRYGIYFELVDENTVATDDDSDRYEVIDSLPVANDQYEFSHNLKGDLSGTGMHKGLNYRHAEADGFFSYDMAIDSTVTNYLVVKYFSGDVGRRFVILVDGELLEDVTIENVNPDGFYDMYYEIPAELVEGKDTVTITFEARYNSYAGGIFDRISIVKDKE